MLHRWAEKGEAWPCKLLLKEGDGSDARTKNFKDCISMEENELLDTPLHIAWRRYSELGQNLVRGYQQEVKASEGEIQELMAVECAPCRTKNLSGKTPLHSTTHYLSKHEELVLDILSIQRTTCKIRNGRGESQLFFAVMFVHENHFDWIEACEREEILAVIAFVDNCHMHPPVKYYE